MIRWKKEIWRHVSGFQIFIVEWWLRADRKCWQRLSFFVNIGHRERCLLIDVFFETVQALNRKTSNHGNKEKYLCNLTFRDYHFLIFMIRLIIIKRNISVFLWTVTVALRNYQSSFSSVQLRLTSHCKILNQTKFFQSVLC